MHDICAEDDEGNKALFTPHLFQVINGKMGDNQICYDNLELDSSPTLAQIEKLEKVYERILKPFVKDSQD